MKSKLSLHVLLVLALALSVGCGLKTGSSGSSSDNSAAPGGSASGGAASATAKATPQPIVIPAGKVITVRLNEGLSSNHSQPGQGFAATVAEPVTVDGTTVIEQGATAHGTVVDAKAMGHFKGGALLHVRLDSVVIKGKEHHIETTAAGSSTKGKGKRSAIAIGGGAGVGAALGAIFGGGKGAAIGAAAGAGAGTAGAAFTGKKEIVFPAETALTFKLKQSVEVQ
ncbi:MAG TPA: hypothetical protein VKE93_14275 [Candidatus Angelobacter sp.]|nr:hypothetical protein [Candidatus Angelobacter sp.]